LNPLALLYLWKMISAHASSASTPIATVDVDRELVNVDVSAAVSNRIAGARGMRV
jgi:hypothetical protein